MPTLFKRLLTAMVIVLLCQCVWAFDEGPGISGASQSGEFKIQASVNELLGETAAQRYAPIMKVDDLIEWEVYVPPTYDPTKPAGLLVYVSPKDSGEIHTQWKSLVADANLIWVAANHSGNKVSQRRRIAYALLAVSMIAREYKISQDRIYVSGFSGGGRIASLLATKFPGLFKGAIYNCGVNFWDESTPETLGLIKNNRFVFITGSRDFNLRDTMRVFKKYEKAGVPQIKLMVIALMGHSDPGADEYAQAIAFLDASPDPLNSVP